MEEVLSYSNMMSKNSDKYQKKAIHNETVDCCAFKGCQRTPINTKRKPFTTGASLDGTAEWMSKNSDKYQKKAIRYILQRYEDFLI